MKSRLFLLCVLVLSSMVTYSQSVPVFTAGQEGHRSYRIPAIIGLPNGHLLAFCEGRVHNAGDFGDINIVMKRSTDGGKTWSALQEVVDYDSLQAGNPAPVVDTRDPAFPGGRIFLFYNTGNNHEGEVRKGKGLREVWYKTSADNGATWSDPVNITAQTHRPSFPPAYSFPEDWRSYANTPGHAMQFESGKFEGRIFVAANHSAGPPQPHFRDYRAHGFYTDDHGKTFRLGGSVAVPGGNEAIAADISGSRLMMNVRNQQGDVRARIVAVSKDGGATWDTAYFDRNLPDPVCQGTLLTLQRRKKGHVLAFCNAADTTQRDNLTLRISTNDGKTWKRSYVIDRSPGALKSSKTAYSDIVRLSRRAVGVLYEKDNYSTITFVPVKIKL
ncbi:exo-alpha-sialidase [Chitinophaga alhagiae]|uniref:exo-alpha-sialidase n=1 Tax=Chitinophaga alhagiae TaxID=2203219 RepID=A0ABN5LNZ4_9BACT|nr:sialidase family protein [Chitinophaga alhagiae]AWO01132.1 exo-alpha-sialidase [Chitinophaga alhagiae]